MALRGTDGHDQLVTISSSRAKRLDIALPHETLVLAGHDEPTFPVQNELVAIGAHVTVGKVAAHQGQDRIDIGPCSGRA